MSFCLTLTIKITKVNLGDRHSNEQIILIHLSLQDSNSFHLVNRGDRIAQLVVERIAMPEIVQVEDLDDTSRGLL